MTPPPIHFTRSLAVWRMQRRLEEESFPRIQMSLIVGLTGASGLVASIVTLRAGIDSMTIRYPLAVACAYLFFLFLLWLWLRTKPHDYVNIPDPSVLPGRGSGDIAVRYTGGGGRFGSGGATSSFDEPAGFSAEISNASSPVGDAVGSIADADEVALPIVAVALAIGLALASFYLVYIAPILFAELLVDGALSYALYRKLRHDESAHWLVTACRRTALPFGATALFLSLAGAAMSTYAPGARSIGEVVHHFSIDN